MRFEIVNLVAVLWVLWLFDLPSKSEFRARNDVLFELTTFPQKNQKKSQKSEMDPSVVVVSIACP